MNKPFMSFDKMWNKHNLYASVWYTTDAQIKTRHRNESSIDFDIAHKKAEIKTALELNTSNSIKIH